MVKSIEDLDVFKLAHELTLKVYRISQSFPKEEQYGLTSQLRRASSSVPANLAEGANRGTTADYRRFVSIAKGSAGETKYHLLLAKDLGYIPQEKYENLTSEYDRVLQMLTKLNNSLGL